MSNSQKTEVLSEKIDWIAYTQKSSIDWQFPAYISDKWKRINPLRNYTNGEENQQGVKRFWNTIREAQGRMVLLDGSASSILGANREEFLCWLNGMDAKPTRLDFALDITHSKFKPQGCVQHLRNGSVKTHAQSALQVHDEFKGGFTQYVGTKTSETYTRIYDKSMEQKTSYNWTRIETVYQGDRAEAGLQAYLQHKSVRPLILAHVDFPKWGAWKRVMSGDVAKLHVPLRETRTRAWLLSQVAKSIAREIAMDEDQSFLFQLIDQIREEYKTLTKGEQNISW
jgi:DNA relaxase NicK